MYEQLLDNGIVLLKNLYDPSLLVEDVPKERGQISYADNGDIIKNCEVEGQVEGCFSRYFYPKYKKIHTDIRLILQKVLKQDLYNTYYFDRFYFKGQELKRHTDRDACEISVSLQISSNSREPWAFEAKLFSGEEVEVTLKDGWGILYMGCDVEHWRKPLKSRHNLGKRALNKVLFQSDDTYHHQIFFHYVLANGHRAHCYYDRCR